MGERLMRRGSQRALEAATAGGVTGPLVVPARLRLLVARAAVRVDLTRALGLLLRSGALVGRRRPVLAGGRRLGLRGIGELRGTGLAPLGLGPGLLGCVPLAPCLLLQLFSARFVPL